MKATISVKNWDEFQHYKDRNPPWIKLHNTLLEDYDFECLQDASKGHLLCIWMLASRTSNKIPYDSEWVSRKIGASDPVDLEGLIAAGFLILNQPLQEVEHDASTVIADSKQSAIPEERRGEGEGETEQPLSPNDDKPKKKAIPYEAIQEIYNKELPTLTASRVLSEKTKRNIAKIWKDKTEHQNRAFWTNYFSGLGQLEGRMNNWAGVNDGNKSGNIELVTRNEIFVRSLNEIIDAGIWE